MTEPTYTCPRCRSPWPPGAAFCPVCGISYAEAWKQPAPPVVQQPAEAAPAWGAQQGAAQPGPASWPPATAPSPAAKVSWPRAILVGLVAWFGLGLALALVLPGVLASLGALVAATWIGGKAGGISDGRSWLLLGVILFAVVLAIGTIALLALGGQVERILEEVEQGLPSIAP